MKRNYNDNINSSVKRICIEHDKSNKQSDHEFLYAKVSQMTKDIQDLKQELIRQDIIQQKLQSDMILAISAMKEEVIIWRNKYSNLESILYNMSVKNQGTVHPRFDINTKYCL